MKCQRSQIDGKVSFNSSLVRCLALIPVTFLAVGYFVLKELRTIQPCQIRFRAKVDDPHTNPNVQMR